MIERKVRVLAVVPVVIVLGLLVGPSGWGAGVSSGLIGLVGGPGAPLGIGVTASLSVGLAVGSHLAWPFWGINTADDNTPASQKGLGAFLNSTRRSR